MSERDRRAEERGERRARRIQEQKVREGKERREERFLRRKRGPPPKKKPEVKEKSYAETVLSGPLPDEDLDPDDPMSQTMWEQAGPLYYTPPEEAPEGTVDPIDKMVTGVTGRLWGRAEEIRSSTEPLSYEEQRYRRVKWEIPSLDLASKRVELGLLNVGIGAVESFTFPVRPSAWGRTAESLVGIATSRERRREVIEFARARPEAVGLQLLGGVAGGYAAGKVIGRIQGPKTYTLKEKTGPLKPRAVTSPATKMPRGKWRSTWEITRKGGTAVVQLKDRPGFISYYEPTPVYGLSRLGFIGLLGLKGQQSASVKKSDVVVEQTIKQTQRVGLDQRQRGREREMFATGELLKERTEQRRTILPDLRPFIRQRPTPTPPGFVEPPIEHVDSGLTYRQTTRQVQELMQEISSVVTTPMIPSYPRLQKYKGSQKIRIPRIPKMGVSPMKLPGLGMGFGLTRRSVLTPEELVTGKKPRKKKKTKKKRKKK